MSSYLEEKDAIQDVLHRYCFHIDNWEWEAVGGLFAPDGEWIAPYARAQGPANIAALMDRLIPPKGQGPERKHFVANLLVTIAGDEATVRSNFSVVRESENGLLISVVGTYDDRMVKLGGKWLFRMRDVKHDIMGDLGLRK